ncbi:GDP-Man:Man(3)GlcNAc(2)-PP-Dol alpha-1,2-mannosyltransferase [Gracilariopsis chorda]|uniref:GDP-Man:Man(3)GlcNAc(2)-PP-Dol alpha-1,2-mannosyltransferase n=1 Tax=Gracilariopsis chorda TaxID=448386 RepID=A0A2V3IIV6_9FLOR|nr:GDP-Man:Man(3)GlcNAc(2)-PP-Dol alpha-1,2-mannosyltransferase [Gracilariopsis chorda]|eukprot:PXF42035.1 GDP-Man:Man(3)GlcNAc(2)-PP-Dol alpha-1,2-mannosyltransferase [Gracilariopsis chorda]
MVSQGALFGYTLLLLLLALLGFRKALRRKRKDLIKVTQRSRSIGFLHPHSLNGGGGERVLWCAVQAIKKVWPRSHIVIYSAWSSVGVGVLDAVEVSRSTVRKQFGLDLTDIDFQPVDISEVSYLTDARNYPRLTLLLQALGALRLGAKAYAKQPVELLIDTANLSFSLIVPKFMGAHTMSYVHYPTISMDMLELVRSRRTQFNNDASIASSRTKSFAKTIYYRLFATLYGVNARFVDVKVANSSWTASHLRGLWRGHVHRVFPPCDVHKDIEEVEREAGLIVSVGQFRPEKNHELQLEMMRYLREKHSDVKCRLVMIGGARNEADKARAEALRKSARREQLDVDVRVNISRQELQQVLRKAWVGVHTMRDEHFGISVVELQASGIVVVAHRSGGVATDIVRDGDSGLLVQRGEEYADAVASVIRDGEQAEKIRERGLRSCERFADHVFRERFGQVVAESFNI